MKAAERFLEIALCLAVGALAVVAAYAIVGDRQPGYLFVAGAAGVMATAEVLERRRKARRKEIRRN